MKANNVKYYIVSALIVLMANGCSKESESDEGNDQELINKVELHFVQVGNSDNHFHAKWEDSNKNGAIDASEIETINVVAGLSYTGEIELYDVSKDPDLAIHEEVEEEKNDHQFFYTPGGGATGRLTVTKTDTDTNNPPLPVGLQFSVSVSAGATVNGTLRVVLSHYDGVAKTNQPSNESDVDITFPVSISNP